MALQVTLARLEAPVRTGVSLYLQRVEEDSKSLSCLQDNGPLNVIQ